MSTPKRPRRYSGRHLDGQRFTVTPVRSTLGDQYGAEVLSCTGLSDELAGMAFRESDGHLLLYVNARPRGRREQLVFLLLVELAGPDASTIDVDGGALTAAVARMPEVWALPRTAR